jgi:hypothetical protein
MTTVTLTRTTRYYLGNAEVWAIASISNEYNISKTAVRTWTTLPSFPKAFAVSEGGKFYYKADEVREWAETTPYAGETIRRSDKGIGRPRKNPQGTADNLYVVRLTA